MRLRTLGGLELESSSFQRPQPLLLLTYLALEGPKDRRFLAELFWLDAKDPLARLSVTLTRLRKGAPGSFGADRKRVWTELETDARKLLAALEAGERLQALDLYRGPFLAGVYLQDWGVELEEWVYGTREFLASGIREAMLGLAEEEAAQGRFPAAAGWAEQAFGLEGAAAAEPELLERIHTLMLAGGSLASERVRREADAYGVSLAGAESEARERLQARVATVAGPLHNLPPRATSFVGRDPEVGEILTLLIEDGRRLVTLTGPGGVGKTRLALEAAGELLARQHFRDGVYLVTLDALQSPEAIPSRLAETLGVRLGESEPPLVKVIDAIGDRDLLLLLDNFEHLMEGAVGVAELLERCPGLAVLVTSRERLNLAAEWVVPVEGLAFPDDAGISLDRARYFDALQLLERRARRVRPDFALTAETLPPALEICRLLEGLPLGIELAAVSVRVLPLVEIAREIRRNLDVLVTPVRDVVPRHQSIRAAFEHSWRLLNPGEQEVLRRASIFRGGFRREAAGRVAGATIPLLSALVDKSLLRVDAGGRFDIHPLLLYYAREKLGADRQERAETEEAHAEFFQERLEGWGGELRSGDQGQALEAIDEELENLRRAWHWLAVHRLPALRRLTASLRLFFDRRGRFEEGHRLLAEFGEEHAAGDGEERTTLGTLLAYRSWLSFRLERYRQAADEAHRGLELLRVEGGRTGVRTALNTLGSIAIRTGDYEAARNTLHESAELAEAWGDRVGLSDSLINLAVLEKDLGDHAAAERHFRDGLDMKLRLGDRASVAVIMNNLGELLRLTGRAGEAQVLVTEGLQLARELGLAYVLPFMLFNLGMSAYQLGDLVRARELAEEAIGLLEQDGDRSLTANVLVLEGLVARAGGDTDRALDLFNQALTLAWGVQGLPDVLWVLREIADCWAKRGETDRAARLLGVVRNHPAQRRYVDEEEDPLLVELGQQLPAPVLAGALAQGAARDLDAVVSEILLEGVADPD